MDAWKEMLNSKKFRAAIAGVLVGVAAKLGLNLDAQTIGVLISPLLAYILGQGLADSKTKMTQIGEVSTEPEKKG